MPTDAVWILATVPQRKFERTLIAFNRKIGSEDHFKFGSIAAAEDDYDDDDDEDYYTHHDGENQAKRPFMQKILSDALEYLQIHDSVWTGSKNGHYYHVYFTCDLESNDHAMHYLQSRGIGSRCNSTLGYIPFGLFYYNEKNCAIDDPDDPDGYNMSYFHEVKDNFLRSVTSRLTVAQVVEGVQNGATITFDFYMYLAWSSTIAAMGMMNNAPVDIAASMMIEPLMGSVMAVSFGLAVQNRHVFWTGVRSLLVGFAFCLAFGYAFGLVFQIWRTAWHPPPAGVWPTPEMQSRGQFRTLIYGAVIALAGGCVLAVILLKNNLVAMAGVAVATTFMPPFVNSGLSLALATHMQIDGSTQPYRDYNWSGTIVRLKPAWTPPPGYSVDFVPDMRVECCIHAVVSIAYTIVNVGFLFLGSYVILKIKEIAPIKKLMPNDHKFFNEDIKIYREHQRKYGEENVEGGGATMGQRILEEWADISGVSKVELMSEKPEAVAVQLQTLYDIADDVEADATFQTITRHAFANKYQAPLRRRLTQAALLFTDKPSNRCKPSKPGDNLNLNNQMSSVFDTVSKIPIRNPFQFSASTPASPSPFGNTGSFIRRSKRDGSIAKFQSSRYSIWPTTEPVAGLVARHRSRTSVSSTPALDVPTILFNRNNSQRDEDKNGHDNPFFSKL